jgi:curved DNA-binding protein CbpA
MSEPTSPYELLGLPISATKPEDLAAAYRAARQHWFLKQFEPQFMLEAHDRVQAIDQAYQALRDPRRQAAILRESHKRPRTVIHEESTNQEPTKEATQPPPRVVNRTKVVRNLLREAQAIIAQTKMPLTDDMKQRITREAFDAGLDYTDAEELTERIVREVEFNLRPRSTRRKA